MPSPNRTPPLLFPPEYAAQHGGEPYAGPILYALGYLTTPARIARRAALRGFGVCEDTGLTVHAFLRRLKNATGVCEGNGLLEVVWEGASNGGGGGVNELADTSGGRSVSSQAEICWLILVKPMTPRAEDMVVPDVLLRRFQEAMPTEDMPVLYRFAVQEGTVSKSIPKRPACACPPARLILGYRTSPQDLYRHALRSGTDVRGDFALTLERILRRVRRVSGAALADTVVKLRSENAKGSRDGRGSWLLVVASLACESTQEGTVASEDQVQTLFSAASEEIVRRLQRIVGTEGLPEVFKCEFPCVCASFIV
ncbi:hypothetical protein BD626DRAFT_565556 [Schizophyllum amplum]|uniref:Uncharacterized protein n=1 Tax=Schizophyllum amplum TaxID=97359 RepID=A0A550CVD0_9AGAR|nr:hypothetical protein BD626DRAFT_565556 [Auriculariopsis ampla]